ncbi:MAG: carbonic anhydrase [Tepidisphaeraceae bacterium]
MLSCADSRVPPEMLFDQGIGDLFVIRVAGNVAATDELGTLEYGVAHLNIPLIVVLGHTRCGAVTAVVDGAHAEGNLARLLEPIAPAAERAKHDHPTLKGPALVSSAIQENVRQSIHDLTANSPVIAKAVAANRVKIVGGVYDIHGGRIEWLDQESLAVADEAPRAAAEPTHVAVAHAAEADTHAEPATPHAAAAYVQPQHAPAEEHAPAQPKPTPTPTPTHTAAPAHATHAADHAAQAHDAPAAEPKEEEPAPHAAAHAAPHAAPVAIRMPEKSEEAKTTTAVAGGLGDHWMVLAGAVVTSTLIGAGVTHFAARQKA